MRSIRAGLAAVCLLLLAAPVFAEDIIVESRKEGQNNDRYEEIEGTWMDSQTPPTVAKSSAPGLTDPNKCGARKVLFSGPSGEVPPLGAARFRPKLTAPGHYYVYTTWSRGANCTPVNYTIKHAKGEDKKVLTQDGWSANGNGNMWHLLGDYDFAAGDDQYVELRIGPDAKRTDAKNYGQVYSDAVRFSSSPLTETMGAQLVPGLSDASAAPPASMPSTMGAPPATGTALPTLADTTPLKWYEDIGSGQSLAVQENKKILVLFFSPQNPVSKYYEDEAFNDATVKNLVRNSFVLVKVNFVENTELAYKLGVFKAGTINIYNSQGRPLDQITDRLQPAELAAKLGSY